MAVQRVVFPTYTVITSCDHQCHEAALPALRLQLGVAGGSGSTAESSSGCWRRGNGLHEGGSAVASCGFRLRLRIPVPSAVPAPVCQGPVVLVAVYGPHVIGFVGPL